MDRDGLQKSLLKTLESSFDENRFKKLVADILNGFVPHPPSSGEKNDLDEGDDSFSVRPLGRYTDPDDKKIDILVVYLKKGSQLDRARTTQRNLIAKHLKGVRGISSKDAALVAFVSPDRKDWRFSFVKIDYGYDDKGNPAEELTPVKRYSFLVGEKESSHTAQSRILPVLQNEDENPTLDDLEEIFSVEKVTKEFFEEYSGLLGRLENALNEAIESDTKIKSDFEKKKVEVDDFAKKLLGQIIFLYFLQKKGWFGVKRGKEWGEGSRDFLSELFGGQHGDYENFFNDILEPLFYEALRFERANDDYYDQFKSRIPFLNGGLFDPIGDYDWAYTDILLSNDIFSSKTKEGNNGDGILDIFNRYNFTVNEDEPLEKEVAIDPEMLGKVFESLLEDKARKSQGTYYTPRDIVHYMCQESLASYLETELNDLISKEDIEVLIQRGSDVLESGPPLSSAYGDSPGGSILPKNIEDNAKRIDEKLAAIRVCDPAVGSGAFPVGMMNEIVRVRSVLTTYIGENPDRSPYSFKRHAIENCLYGVDVAPGAVEISKLRLWLSLIVDEDDRKTIKPLPNLDYKIVQGNSLLGFERNVLNSKLFDELEELKTQYFNETNVNQKSKYKGEIDDLILNITDGYTDFNFEVYFSEIFQQMEGFNVVIGNPPYVNAWTMTKETPELRAEIKSEFRNYPFLIGHWDLYVAFMAKGHQILCEGGNLAYIVPNTILREKYASELRRYLLEETTMISLLMFNEINVFQNVSRRTTVLITQKTKPSGNYRIPIYINQNNATNILDEVESSEWLNNPRYLFLVSSHRGERQLLEKIDRKSQKLGNYFYVNTGAQVSSKKSGDFAKRDVVSKEPKNNAKPFFEGKDVQRWRINYRNLYLDYREHEMYGPRVRELFETNKIVIRRISNKDHKLAVAIDSTASYTDDGNVLIVPYSAIMDTNLRSEFKEFKILDTQIHLKYVLAILLSDLETFYFRKRFATESLQGSTSHTYPSSVRGLPIFEIPLEKQKPFIDLVDQILALTGDDSYIENDKMQVKVEEYEKQINELIYNLYDLMDEEIKIIHGDT